MLQQVFKTPEPEQYSSSQDSLLKSEKQSAFMKQSYSYFWRKRYMDQEDDAKSKAERFKCIALQH